MENDYIIDFFNSSERLVYSISDILNEKVRAGRIDLQVGLSNMLLYVLYSYRDAYINYRLSGLSEKSCWARVVNQLFDGYNSSPLNYTYDICLKRLPEEIKYIFYCNGPRSLAFLKPIIERLDIGSLLILDCNRSAITGQCNLQSIKAELMFIPDSFRLNNAKTIADRVLSVVKYYDLFNRLICSNSINSVIGIDGCQTPLKVLADAGRKVNVKSFCIQSCWPSFFHGGYKNLPYSDIITWGKGFSNLWKGKNNNCNCTVGGYQYEISKSGLHDCIAFFLQAPLFLSTKQYLMQMHNLIVGCARAFPYISILVRSHPEYKLHQKLKDDLMRFPNISFVDEMNLSVVFSKARIGISHFSSCIMECLAHNCIPIVFDPVYRSRYYPDIEELKIGYIMDNPDDVVAKIRDIYVSNENCHEQNRELWFASCGSEATNRIADILKV